MKQYKSLAKLYQNLVHDARKEIRRLQEEKDKMLGYQKVMQQEIDTLNNDGIVHAVDVANYNAYKAKLFARIQSIHDVVKQVDVQIEQLEEEIREQFANQKVFDHLYDNAMRGMLLKQEKQATALLDELASVHYLKRKY